MNMLVMCKFAQGVYHAMMTYFAEIVKCFGLPRWLECERSVKVAWFTALRGCWVVVFTALGVSFL